MAPKWNHEYNIDDSTYKGCLSTLACPLLPPYSNKKPLISQGLQITKLNCLVIKQGGLLGEICSELYEPSCEIWQLHELPFFPAS